MGVKKKSLAVNPGRCVGCLTCMLRCSYRFSGTYCPSLAAVTVSGPHPEGGGFSISFDDRCDGCGICAAFCLYGSITGSGGGGAGQ